MRLPLFRKPIEAESAGADFAIQGARKTEGGRARSRVLIAMLCFTGIYGTIGGRLAYYGMQEPGVADSRTVAETAARPDLVDRNGETLATDIKTASLYAEPKRIIDADEALELLSSVLPDLDQEQTYSKLKSGLGFVWLKRQLTPRQQSQIMALGLPGIGFRTEKQRYYPGGANASHIVGLVDVDNRGIAGMEKYVDQNGLSDLREAGMAIEKDLAPVKLSIDCRVQHVLHDELAQAMDRYRAIGAGAVVLNVHTGEVVAMASLPDYDPNNPYNAMEKDRLNRMSAGVYEMGSTFKTFTTAMALDSGKVNMNSKFDARRPIQIARFTINDFHGKKRILSVPEVFIYSSNIGSAKEADVVGIAGHREFLHRIGLLRQDADRAAGSRQADRAERMEEAQFDHDFLRPWRFDDALADGGGGGGVDEWRHADPADFPAAEQGRGGGAGGAGGEARDQRADALSVPAQCRKGLRQAGGSAGLYCRRQDRHGGKGSARALFDRQAVQRLPRRVSDDQARICGAGGFGRAEGGRWQGRHDGGIERGPDCQRHYAAHGGVFGRQAGFWPGSRGNDGLLSLK